MRTLRDRAMSFRQPDRQGADPWRTPFLAGDRRRVRRVSCRSTASFRESQRKPVEARIVNLSTHGCAVTGAEAQKAGARCWIILPSLESWEAKVAWSDGATCGLDFSRPLHRAVAELVIERTNGTLPWPAAG